MITTEHPSPNMHITVLDHIVTVHAGSESEVTFVSDEMVINRISIEVRAHFKRAHSGHWISTNIFAYRLDVDGQSTRQHATEGQTSKLYSAFREAAEQLPATFLLDGQDAKIGREIERLGREIDEKKLEVGKLVQEQRTLRTQYETSVLSK